MSRSILVGGLVFVAVAVAAVLVVSPVLAQPATGRRAAVSLPDTVRADTLRVIVLDPVVVTVTHLETLRSRGGVSLENRGARRSGAAKLFLNFGTHRIQDGFRSRDYTAGLQYHQGFTLGSGGTVTLGADARRFGGEARRNSEDRPADWGSHDVAELGVFGLVHYPVLTGLVATGGVRLNHHGNYGVELAPQLGVAYSVAAGTTLRASSSRGFRSPTIRELYLFPAPSPDLEPERARNNEVSVLQHVGGRASLELVAYRIKGTNLIRVSGSGPNMELANSGSFLHRGGELVLAVEPLDALELDVSYGYMEVGELTQLHPRNQLQLAARYSFGRFDSALGVQRVTGIYGSDGGRDRLLDYTVAGVRLGARLHARGGLFVSADNILAADYTIMRDYPMPGRVLNAGLQLRSR